MPKRTLLMQIKDDAARGLPFSWQGEGTSAGSQVREGGQLDSDGRTEW